MGGFEPEIADLVAGAFRESGFTPIITGAARRRYRPDRSAARRRCGRRVAHRRRSRNGRHRTVTHIDGDRVYAFGHPFYNLGPAEFPMTRAHVFTMLPSLMTSFKISSLGRNDRDDAAGSRDAIAGAGQGPGAGADDHHRGVRSRSGAQPVTRTVKLNLVNDQLFTPLLAYVSMFNTLGVRAPVWRRDARGEEPRPLEGHGDLTLEDVFANENPILGASTAVAGPLR